LRTTVLEGDASISILVGGLIENMTTYSDGHEPRPAAERLAEERADG